MAGDFARLLESRYATGPGFTAAYLDYFESGDGKKIETERESGRIGPYAADVV